MRFLPNSGDGDWSDEHGQGEMFEPLHCKLEPDLDMINTEAALDRWKMKLCATFQEPKVLA